MQKFPATDEQNFTETTHSSSQSTMHLEESTSRSSDSNYDIPINLNDFLDFLNLSCHVNDMIAKNDKQKELTPVAEGAINKAKPCVLEIDFARLAENRLVNQLCGFKRQASRDGGKTDGSDCKSNAPSTSTSTATTSLRRTETVRHYGLHPKLNEKLDYVIDEGVVDSVLSFICPVPVPPPLQPGYRSKAKQQLQKEAAKMPAIVTPVEPVLTDSTKEKEPTQSVSSTAAGGGSSSSNTAGAETTHLLRATLKEPGKLNATAIRRRSLLASKEKYNAMKNERKEPEVIIHVCDEVKNTSRDFTCPQGLLISKMGYFADVTAGQKLEEMDISVHCDVQIFDWLMRWVKHSATNSIELHGSPTQPTGPQLDGNNVVPILVSASFLQMEPLLLECLTFCHAHLNEVVRTSTNLSCLNDSIVTRLAAMFTNLELEMVRDKKERVTPRLWTKLIQSLCEPEPEALRGHFYSMSGLFRCARCSNCITNTMKSYVTCVPSNIRLNRWGQLISHHARDSTWDINIFILQLFKELKSWRKVYWKLWGHCHYLYCCTCELHFPVYQMTWCRYHPENPNFLGPVAEGRIAGPTGRYACCGQQAFRFETLPGPNGCQFREHSVLVETDRERAILAIAQLVGENYALCESPPMKMQELAATAELHPCWMGISLTPQRCRQGLLPHLNIEESNFKLFRRTRASVSAYFKDTSSDSDSSSTTDEPVRGRSTLRGAASRNYSSSSDGCESEHCGPKKSYTKKGRKRQPEIPGRFWSGELSARSNQDHQRDFEEKVMKHVIAFVNKRSNVDQSVPQSNAPLGGSYVRLEQEWKEQVKQRHNSNHTNSASNLNIGSATSVQKQKHK